MNGIHDLGGMHGFGPIAPEPDEPVFHAEWERRCFALTLAAGFLGRWNIDMSRFAREGMDPGHYLTSSYYEHWLYGLEVLLHEQGLLSAAELESGVPRASADGELRALPADRVEATLLAGGSARLPDAVVAKFQVGERVLVRNLHPHGHTRMPRYLRGRYGIVDRDHGVFVFPDTHAAGRGNKPQHLYSVRFEGGELWGPQGGGRDAVYADLWDDYLEAA